MRTKNLLLFISLIGLITSCKTYQTAWYYSELETKPELGFQEVIADKESIEIAFFVKPVPTSKKTVNQTYTHMKQMESKYKSTISSRDAQKMIEGYFGKSSLQDSSNVLPLKLKMVVVKGSHKINGLYTVPSVLTLSLINLFGFPIASQKVHLAVKAGVYDLNDNLIKTYTCEGVGKATSAYYWGYSGVGAITNDGNSPLCRVTNTFALKAALDNLKEEIYNDYKELKSLSQN